MRLGRRPSVQVEGQISPSLAARLGYVAVFGAVGASIPYLSVYYGSLGLGLDAVGLLSSLAACIGLVGSPLWGVVADRLAGSRLVMPGAAILGAAAATALALVRGPIPVVAAVAVMSLAMAGLIPILDARALETVRGDRDRYSQLRVWGSASFIVVVWLTGALVERAGIASMFAIYVPALQAIAVVTVPLRGEAAIAPPLPRLTGIGLVLRQPPLARFLVAALIVWSASTAINWFFSLHLLAIGAPGEVVGAAWALGALVEIPIMWAYPAIASRVGTERLLVAGAVALALRAATISFVDDPLLVTLTMALHGIGFALMLVGGVTYVARHAPPAAAATAQGILSATVFGLALVIGPGLGGLAAGAWGLPTMFVLATLIGSVAVVAMVLAMSRRRVPVEAVS